MSARELERRLTQIEQEVASLKAEHRPAAISHPVEVLERIHGIFERDDAFEEAARLGRKWRATKVSSRRNSKAKRK